MAGVVGKPPSFNSVEEFEERCLSYIEWVKDNPVEKTITAAFQGIINYEKVPTSRPMTQLGLAVHMGVGLSTLKDWGAKEEYSATFQYICALMTSWNIDGATCGDMSGNIVSRIEGLAEKQVVENNVTVQKGLSDFYDET